MVGTGNTRAGAGQLALDLRDEAAIRQAIDRERPDLCVLAAALTNVERCEGEPELAEALNARAPAVAAAACRAAGGRTVYLSTEYVFDGTAGPYGEDDAVCPISVYGRTKLGGERAVLAADPAALVVRTTVVFSFSPGDKNFLMQLLERLGAGEPMRVPADQISSPTYAPFLGATIAALATTVSGVLNVAGAEVMDRATFAETGREALGLDPGLIVPVRTSELGQRARRPLRAGLRVHRLGSLGIPPPRLEMALADVAERRRRWALERPGPDGSRSLTQGRGSAPPATPVEPTRPAVRCDAQRGRSMTRMDVVPATRGHWRSFFLNLSLVVLLAVSGLYTGLALSTGRTIEAEITTRARTIFGAVAAGPAAGTRSTAASTWRSGPGWSPARTSTNPDRLGTDGTVYTMRNPEMMTREMSAAHRGGRLLHAST